MGSCNDKTSLPSEDPILNQVITRQFPEDFLGIYKGDLKITSNSGERLIPMEFQLQNSDSTGLFKYSIHYDVENQEPRRYNLKRTSNPNIYLVDENNGIVLESAYANHTLYSTYEAAGNLLNSTQIFYQDRMEFMIALSKVRDTIITGSQESALVKNYPFTVMQRATLFKQVD